MTHLIQNCPLHPPPSDRKDDLRLLPIPYHTHYIMPLLLLHILPLLVLADTQNEGERWSFLTVDIDQSYVMLMGIVCCVSSWYAYLLEVRFCDSHLWMSSGHSSGVQRKWECENLQDEYGKEQWSKTTIYCINLGQCTKSEKEWQRDDGRT